MERTTRQSPLKERPQQWGMGPTTTTTLWKNSLYRSSRSSSEDSHHHALFYIMHTYILIRMYIDHINHTIQEVMNSYYFLLLLLLLCVFFSSLLLLFFCSANVSFTNCLHRGSCSHMCAISKLQKRRSWTAWSKCFLKSSSDAWENASRFVIVVVVIRRTSSSTMHV